MKMFELVEPKDVEFELSYHDNLNPKLWDGIELKKEIKDQLIEIANQFIEFLELPDNSILDITMTGSNANYNWTRYSDIDVHIIIDKELLAKECELFIDGYLDSKRKVWNDQHDITIFGHEVELYPQPVEEKHTSTGVYSLLYDGWNISPEYKPTTVDDHAVKAKAAQLMNEIDSFIKMGCNLLDEMDEFKDKIKKMRKSGLSTNGEMSVENLAFKVLRNNGYLEKLFGCYTIAYDKSLSLGDIDNDL